MDFVSELIEVEVATEPGGLAQPVAFTWRGERYPIAQIVVGWHSTGFADRRRRHGWWERRHRNYYRLRTAGGELWEIYLDRAGGRRRWYMSRHWLPGEADMLPETAEKLPGESGKLPAPEGKQDD